MEAEKLLAGVARVEPSFSATTCITGALLSLGPAASTTV
jgi:hypothetical protein